MKDRLNHDYPSPPPFFSTLLGDKKTRKFGVSERHFYGREKGTRYLQRIGSGSTPPPPSLLEDMQPNIYVFMFSFGEAIKKKVLLLMAGPLRGGLRAGPLGKKRTCFGTFFSNV